MTDRLVRIGLWVILALLPIAVFGQPLAATFLGPCPTGWIAETVGSPPSGYCKFGSISLPQGAAFQAAEWIKNGTTPNNPHKIIDPLQTISAVAPYPGYWHCGTAGNFLYCPCFPPPYTLFTDPANGNVGYFRYDFAPLKLSPPKRDAGQGGPNHSIQWYDANGYLDPMDAQPHVNGFYPAPPTTANLCDIWGQYNTGLCPNPPGGYASYSSRMRVNPVWVAGYNYKLPVMQADPGCNGTAPTNTPVRTPTRTPTGPTVTPNLTRTPTPQFVCVTVTPSAP